MRAVLLVPVNHGNPAERIYVIAPNDSVYKLWCFDNHINPLAPNIRYVTTADQLRGLTSAWYINLGLPEYPLPTAPERQHLAAAVAVLHVAGARNAEAIQDDETPGTPTRKET